MLQLIKLYFLPSFIKVFLLKRKGKVGSNFKIGIGSWINCDDVHIGNNVNIGNFTTITTKKLHIDNNTSIGSRCNIEARQNITIGKNNKISEQNVFGGTQTPSSSFFSGKNVHIYPYCFINTSLPVVFEDGVGIGGSCYIFTHGSWQDAYEGYPYSYAPVTIKKNAWLPWRVFVMPGVTIGENATIGSAALVGKDIPDQSFAVGMPAKVLKQGNEYVKVMTTEEKLKLMSSIFEAYVPHLEEFYQIKAELSRTEAELIVRLADGHEQCFTFNEARKNNGLLITECNSTPITNNVIDMKSKSFISLKHKADSLLIEYLTNFGIRIEQQ
jgi:acetyltransferase-like isoleucine patch superfamily enzyme